MKEYLKNPSAPRPRPKPPTTAAPKPDEKPEGGQSKD